MSILFEIEKEISDFITPLKATYSDIAFDFSVMFQSNTSIKFEGYCLDEYHGDVPQPFIMLVVNILDNQLQIPNIFLPKAMHHKNIGLSMISILRTIANKYSYDLFIVDMVPSFYNRMLRRGALPCNNEYGRPVDDVVKIVEKTDLAYYSAG